MPRSKNPFNKDTQPINHVVAEMLLSGELVSYEEMKAQCNGAMSPRNLGIVLRALENEGHRFVRTRTPEWGVCYQHVTGTEAKKTERISNPESTDSRHDWMRLGQEAPAPAPVKKAAAKAPVKKATPAPEAKKTSTRPVKAAGIKIKKKVAA